jgi:ABC-type taurine transport system substrate-binding protein
LEYKIKTFIPPGLITDSLVQPHLNQMAKEGWVIKHVSTVNQSNAPTLIIIWEREGNS